MQTWKPIGVEATVLVRVALGYYPPVRLRRNDSTRSEMHTLRIEPVGANRQET